MRRYVEEFMRQREGWKELEKHRLEEENQRILDFAKLQAEREHARQMARKEAEEMRSEIVKQVSHFVGRVSCIGLHQNENRCCEMHNL